MLKKEPADDWGLSYTDNGPGLPEGNHPQAQKNLEVRLIIHLSRQRKGRFEYRDRYWVPLFKADKADTFITTL